MLCIAYLATDKPICQILEIIIRQGKEYECSVI